MATKHLVSVEEYLHTSFEHDAEYVEGTIVYRPAPKKPHSKMQSFLDRKLYEIGQPLGYKVWPEQRIRTQANPPRYRVPDLCVTFGEPMRMSSPNLHIYALRSCLRTTWPRR
jgi:Uma2 family endonuclease